MQILQLLTFESILCYFLKYFMFLEAVVQILVFSYLTDCFCQLCVLFFQFLYFIFQVLLIFLILFSKVLVEVEVFFFFHCMFIQKYFFHEIELFSQLFEGKISKDFQIFIMKLLNIFAVSNFLFLWLFLCLKIKNPIFH